MSNLRTYNPFSMDPVDEFFSGFFRPIQGNEAFQAPQIRGLELTLPKKASQQTKRLAVA